MKYLLITLFILFIIMQFISSKKEGFIALPGLNPLRTRDSDEMYYNHEYLMNSMKYYDPTYYELNDNMADPKVPNNKCRTPNRDFIHTREDDFDDQEYISYSNRTLAKNLVPYNYTDYLNSCDSEFNNDEKFKVINVNRTKTNINVPFQASNFYWKDWK